MEPSEGEQDERYDERTDRVLDSNVSGARLEPGEKRRKATRWNEPVHGRDGKEQDAKKSGDQRQRSVHRADVREDCKFSVTLLGEVTRPGAFVRPNGPTLVDRPPAALGWLHEAVSGFVSANRTSRRGPDFTDRLLASALRLVAH